MSGQLLVLEGPDGVGKTTIADGLEERLKTGGIPVRRFSSPGNQAGTLGALVYAIHHEPRQFGLTRLPSEALQALHIAAHLDMIDNDVKPAIKAGDLVLLDRFWWSTWVYGRQYNAARPTLDALIQAEQIHWDPIVPRAVILLNRSNGDQQLAQLYEQLGGIQSAHHPVLQVSNSLSPHETVSAIMHLVSPLLMS